MKVPSIFLMIALGLTPAALAQQARARQQADARGERPRGPAAMLERLSERMVQSLNLTPAQAEQLKGIVDEFRPRFEQSGLVDFRAASRKLAEARASGDEQQIAAAEAEIEQARTAQEKLIGEFFDQVEPILGPEQKGRLDDMRMRFSGDAHRPPRAEREIEGLPEELQLTPEQQKKFDELAATWRAAREAQRDQTRGLVQELREAQRAGDENRVAELRKELEQSRSAPDPSEAFYMELEKILTDQQKAKLAEIRASAGGRYGREGRLRVRTVVRAAERLDLTKEQREAIREITRKAMREAREAKPDQRVQVEAEIAKRVEKEVAAVLTPEQLPQFEEALKQQGPRRPRHHRPPQQPAEVGTQPEHKQP
jgi:Spy/CpxP family protein refolding chaperone